jgi:hypothetical protein
MTTDYYTGVELFEVPTGFGGYTGIAVTNSGDFPVFYTAIISDTSVNVDSADAEDGELYNTLFISNNVDYVDSNSYELSFSVNPNDSGIFYVLHKPFSTFVAGSETEADETATLSIYSNSSLGDSDELITIDVTGQRVTGFQEPSRVAGFYAIKNYRGDDGFNLNFNWSFVSGNTYVTGFKLDLSSTSDFLNPIGGPYYLEALKNTSLSLPEYGKYDGFIGENFSITVSNLPISQSIYSRITAINPTGGTGEYCYPTGFSVAQLNLDNKTYSGLHPEPGENLGFTADFLNLEYEADFAEDFDIAKFLYESNGNSYDFRFYSGARITFSPANNEMGVLAASSINNGALNLVKPEDGFYFNTGNNKLFKLELEFRNMKVLGFGGANAVFNADGTIQSSQQGGPIFNFDNLDYVDSDDPNNTRVFSYYIKKDLFSLFYAGLGGSDIYYLTNEETGEQDPREVKEISTLEETNLVNVTNSNNINSDRAESGQLASPDTEIYPNIYLNFIQETPQTDLLGFRFRTDNISASANTTTNQWVCSTDSSFKLQNPASVLTIREAYGRKFFELERESGMIKQIGAKKYLPIRNKPSYVNFVFALARDSLSGTTESAAYRSMIDSFSNMHKFVGIGGPYNPVGGDYAPIYNLKTSGSLCKAIFNGGILNNSYFLGKTNWIYNASVFDYVNPSVRSHVGVYPYMENSIDTGQYKGNPNILNPFSLFNIRNLGSLNNPDGPEDFILTGAGSGSSDLPLQLVSFFFVQMHITNVYMPMAHETNYNRFLYDTYVNGILTSRFNLSANLKAFSTVASPHQYKISLNNDSTTNDRLFLFDYTYGYGNNPEDRNFKSNQSLGYLVKDLAPLLFKTTDPDFQILQSTLDENQPPTYVKFPVPIAHNFLNLYTN